jgi:hypothetical protein
LFVLSLVVIFAALFSTVIAATQKGLTVGNVIGSLEEIHMKALEAKDLSNAI